MKKRVKKKRMMNWIAGVISPILVGVLIYIVNHFVGINFLPLTAATLDNVKFEYNMSCKVNNSNDLLPLIETNEHRYFNFNITNQENSELKIENVNLEVKTYKPYNKLKEIHGKGGPILVENINYLAKITSEEKQYDANPLIQDPFYKSEKRYYQEDEINRLMNENISDSNFLITNNGIAPVRLHFFVLDPGVYKIKINVEYIQGGRKKIISSETFETIVGTKEDIENAAP